MTVFIAAIKTGTDTFIVSLRNVKYKSLTFSYVALLKNDSVNTSFKSVISYWRQWFRLEFGCMTFKVLNVGQIFRVVFHKHKIMFKCFS